MLHSTSIAKAQSAAIVQTLADLATATDPSRRFRVSAQPLLCTSGCTCCPKGGRR